MCGLDFYKKTDGLYGTRFCFLFFNKVSNIHKSQHRLTVDDNRAG